MSSLGFSALVIWDISKNNNNQDSQTADLQKELDKQMNNQKKLEGTNLEGFQPIKDVAKLKTIDLKAGDGKEAKLGSNVTVNYTGAVAATGKIFQSSLDSGQPVPFTLKSGALIQGWVDGVPGMKVGGKRRILIPAAEAYGDHPPQGSGIPPNAALVFDIELLKVE